MHSFLEITMYPSLDSLNQHARSSTGNIFAKQNKATAIKNKQRQVDLYLWGQPDLQSEFQDSQHYIEKPWLHREPPPYSLK